jgi:hypothetical protein
MLRTMKSGMPLPPFRLRGRAESWVALAYVKGRYSPPGRRLGPRGFLGLYLSPVQEGFNFCTFKTDGHWLACRQGDASLEFTLIRGLVDFAVPFEQWRLYPIGPGERRIVRELNLTKEYDEARQALCRVLYLTRRYIHDVAEKLAIDLGLDPKQALRPMFAIRPRSRKAIIRDTSERDEIGRAWLASANTKG